MTSKIKGRPANNPPALAFEYRRYITLVQVLALDNPTSPIERLCESWHIAPGETFEDTVNRLAQHAIDYHRTQNS